MIIPVSSNADAGSGTLRQAFMDASNGDSIRINSSISSIALSTPISIGSGKSLTVYSEDNDYVTITSDGSITDGNYLFGINLGTNDRLKFEKIIFLCPSTNGGIAGLHVEGNGVLELSFCDFVNFGNSVNNLTAIHVHQGLSQLIANDCNFRGTKDTSSGSIYITKTGVTDNIVVTLDKCKFEQVKSPIYGLYVLSDDSANVRVNVNDCIFNSDRSTSSLAIYLNTQTDGIIDMIMRRSTILNVTEVANQRGIEVLGSGTNSLLLVECTITKMESNGSGAAIFISTGNTTRLGISDCVISQNKSASNGGAIFVSATPSSYVQGYIRRTQFLENETSNVGGAIYLRIDSGYVFGMRNCKFDSNSAANGSAIYCNNHGTFIIAESTLTNNLTSSLGAIYFTNYGKATINRCVFDSNDSTGSGTTCLYLSGTDGSDTDILSSCFVNSEGNYPPIRLIVGGTNAVPKKILFENCTIANNIANTFSSAIEIKYDTPGTIIMNNNTIANNISRTASYPAFDFSELNNADPIVIFNNNLIFNNMNNNGEYNISNKLSTYTKNNSRNNIITVDNSVLTNGVNGNIIGTTSNPISIGDLHVGTLDDTYGGDTYVIPLELGSIAINAGDPILGFMGGFDQRGAPYLREFDGNIDVGAFEFQDTPIPCFDGESLIVTRNIKTKAIKKIPAKNVYAGVHEVFDTVRKKFIPIIHNTVTEGATKIVLFEKDVLGPNKPDCDFKITSGHMMFINGKEVKARDVKEGKRMTVKPQKVYSIVTKKWTPIKINNLEVFAWSEHKWKAISKRRGVCWVENKPE